MRNVEISRTKAFGKRKPDPILSHTVAPIAPLVWGSMCARVFKSTQVVRITRRECHSFGILEILVLTTCIPNSSIYIYIWGPPFGQRSTSLSCTTSVHKLVLSEIWVPDRLWFRRNGRVTNSNKSWDTTGEHLKHPNTLVLENEALLERNSIKLSFSLLCRYRS